MLICFIQLTTTYNGTIAPKANFLFSKFSSFIVKFYHYYWNNNLINLFVD